MFIAPWKSAPPSLPTHLAPRRPLLDVLLASERIQAALVSAPAGFGKSVLLAQACKAFQPSGGVAAWASVDAGDEPDRLLSLLHLVLDQVGVAQSDAARQAGRIDALLERIVQDGRSIWLFLDDADRAPVDARRLIAELVRDAPARLRIIMSARNSAILPVARLLTAQTLKLLTGPDLIFGDDDITVMGRGLSSRHLHRLQAMSGGWPVAAASLMELSINGAAVSYEGCGLFDYVEQEVVTCLTGEELEVLSACALLKVITAAASVRITGASQAPEHLSSAAHKLAGLSERLQGEEAHYRLNPVLQAFFLNRLLRAAPAVSRLAVEQSCAVLARQGLVAEAVRIAQEASRPDLALQTIIDCGALALWMTRGIDEVREVLRFAGRELTAAQPKLQLMSAVVNLKAGRIPDAERVYDAACRAWPPREPHWDLSVVRLALLVYGCRRPTESDLTVFHDLVQRTRHEPTWRTFVDSAVCLLQIENGELEAAGISAASAIAIVGPEELPYAALFLNYHLAAISAVKGDTRRARGMLRSGRGILQAQFSKDYGAETVGAVQTAELDYEVGHLSAARMRLRLMTSQLHQMEGWFDIYAAAFTTAARLIHHDLGLAPAREHLRTTGEALRSRDLARVAEHLDVVDRLLVGEALLRGQAMAIESDLGPISRPKAPGWREFESSALADAYAGLADDKPATVCEQLDELIRYAREREIRRAELRALLLKAVALDQLEGEDVAYACFLDAIAIGRRTAFRRAFLDFGGVANAARLRRVAEAGDPDDARFATSLLPQMHADAGEPDALKLTPREREVLLSLEDGGSDKALGRRLGVSEHAIRFHLKNIFLKLQAHTRLEALSHARRLGILDPT